MAALDGFTPVKSLGLGAALSGVNPKNLVLTAGAAMSIAQTGLVRDPAHLYPTPPAPKPAPAHTRQRSAARRPESAS